VNIGDLLLLVLNHCFAGLFEQVTRLPDPRDSVRITYSIEHLFALGLLMFCGHSKSRRAYDDHIKEAQFIANLGRMLNEDLAYTARADSMNYLFEGMNPDEGPNSMALLLPWMVKSLLQARCLEQFRFEHEYLVRELGMRHPDFGVRMLAVWSEAYHTALDAVSSAERLAEKLGEHLRNRLLSSFALDLRFARSVQMRFVFDTS